MACKKAQKCLTGMTLTAISSFLCSLWEFKFSHLDNEQRKEQKEFRKKYDMLGKKFGIGEEKIRVMTTGGGELDDGMYEPSEKENSHLQD